ncbi:MAG: CBS domain-containing protein [Euryarchaeota archaeon]|nr:CBS domain-containing protein [Euryarchaeota archaeon]
MDTEVMVREAMTRSVVTIEPEATVQKAAKLMADNNIGCVVVVEKGEPVGIVTERDLAYFIADTDLKPSLVKVRDIMSADLKTISPDSTVTEASKLMVKYNIRRLPVIDKGKLVGIITNKDILAIAPGQIEMLREIVAMKGEGGISVHEPEPEKGTCENCGDMGVNLYEVNGTFVCEACREDMLEGEEE